MKTLKLFFLSVLGFLQFGSQVIRYALIFASAFLWQRASPAFEPVAIRSQLTFYKESIRQKEQPRLFVSSGYGRHQIGVDEVDLSVDKIQSELELDLFRRGAVLLRRARWFGTTAQKEITLGFQDYWSHTYFLVRNFQPQSNDLFRQSCCQSYR